MQPVPTSELPVLWRTKLRSTLPGVDHSEQVEHCLDRQLIGIGWGVPDLADGAPIEEVLAAVENYSAEGWGKGSQNIRRFANGTAIDDFVWTRDTFGRYLLGRITGHYRYDNSKDAKRVDVHHVRAVEWAPRELNDLEVPGRVIQAFSGPGESWCRINDNAARAFTPSLWAKLRGEPLPNLDVTAREVLTSHLDAYDVEDLVYVWLQVASGYIAMPRARRRDTPAYEFTMVHRRSGRRAIAQVKTGSARVNLSALAGAVVDDATDTFAYATSGRYRGKLTLVTKVIADEELLRFSRDHRALLPGRVRTWFELASDF